MFSETTHKRSVDRRQFIAGSSAGLLSLKFAAPVLAQDDEQVAYGAWEDLMREKWTWDRVVHGTHGTNCQGGCAFNVYVKDGIVWREEQQGEYGKSDPDAPDYGPRGCQKGLRHAKYMYGSQRVLYPMKRVGERGAGQWERVTWDEALADIADRFLDTCVEHGPESVTFGMGTQMAMKRASMMSSSSRIAGTSSSASSGSTASATTSPVTATRKSTEQTSGTPNITPSPPKMPWGLTQSKGASTVWGRPSIGSQ